MATEESSLITEKVTMELSRRVLEDATFGNVTTTEYDKPYLYPYDPNDPTNHKVSKLNAQLGKVIGPSKVMAVKRAETIDVSTQYWYTEAPGQSPLTDLSEIMAGVLLNLTGSGIGVIPTGPETGLSLINNVSGTQYKALENFILDEFDSVDLATTGAHLVYPESRLSTNKDFLRSRDCQIYETEFMSNFIKIFITQARDLSNMFFNKRMELDTDLSGRIAVSEANVLGNINQQNMIIPEDGFFYVYVSNLTSSNVYFDNLTIKRWKPQVRITN